MARTPEDNTPEYTESVRQAILTRCTGEIIDERCLDLASCYLWWNGYKDDSAEPLYADTPGDPLGQTAHAVYDVLRWTEENT